MRNIEFAPSPDKQLNSDDRFKKILERHALIWLEDNDKEYFERHYSGVAESGYLLDKDGKETNFLPSQVINVGFEDVFRDAKNEFIARWPKDAETYGLEVVNRRDI